MNSAGFVIIYWNYIWWSGQLVLSAKKGGIGVAMPTSNSSSNGFKIFCDVDPGIQSSLPPSTGEWQVPPTEPVIKRENTQKPGKWTDAKVEPKKIFCFVFIYM